MKIAVLNTKGGSGKSTNSFQVAAAYFLSRGEEITLYEMDDENRDAENFKLSAIQTKQLKVGDGSSLDDTLFEVFGDKTKNQVLDVGGNKTTTMVVEAMLNTRIYLNFDLFIIPIAGGSQDMVNAQKTFDLIKDFGRPIAFSLSRARCELSDEAGIQFQYRKFFEQFPGAPWYALRDSNCVDLSRELQKSAYELAFDDAPLKGLEAMLIQALEQSDRAKQKNTHSFIKIYKQSKGFYETSLKPAFELIERLTTPQQAKPKTDKKEKEETK